MITPEQAQQRTEQAWQARTEDRVTPKPSDDCGWCEFADGVCVEWCPIYRIVDKKCYRLPRYGKWYFAIGPLKLKDASVILEWLVENRKQLIAAAYEILEEGKENEKR